LLKEQVLSALVTSFRAKSLLKSCPILLTDKASGYPQNPNSSETHI
jgi:hypothetical protein